MKKLIAVGIAILMILSGCFSTPAREVTNICDLLDEKVSWYKAVKKSEEKWGAPMHLQLAIIYQESHFASNAKPPRNKIFGIIPGARPTTSFGFTQAKKATLYPVMRLSALSLVVAVLRSTGPNVKTCP